MKKIITTATVLVVTVFAALSQSSKEKAVALAAEFNKEKHKIKEKNGVTTEEHKVVKAKPDVRDNVASYAGKYEIEGLGHYIVLRQKDDSWEGEYLVKKDGKEVKKATLKDIKIEAALLTATIHHEDGRVLPFEGVFIERSANGETSSGLGIRHQLELGDGFSVDKAFYKRAE